MLKLRLVAYLMHAFILQIIAKTEPGGLIMIRDNAIDVRSAYGSHRGVGVRATKIPHGILMTPLSFGRISMSFGLNFFVLNTSTTTATSIYFSQYISCQSQNLGMRAVIMHQLTRRAFTRAS